MDISISRWITETFGSSKAVAVIAKIVTFAGSKWVIIAIALALLCFKKTRKLGIYAAIICGATWVFNDFILKAIVKRDRPFVVDSNLTKMCELAGYELPDGYSMASGHSAVSMALSITVILFYRKWSFFGLLYPLFEGLSRLMLCVHFATDILVGWGIGLIVAIILFYLLNYLFRKICDHKEKNNEKVSLSNTKSK